MKGPETHLIAARGRTARPASIERVFPPRGDCRSSLRHHLLSSALFLLVITLLVYTPYAAFAGTVDYSYDAAGRLVAADYGSNAVSVFTYDLNGNLLNRTTAPATNADVRLSKSSDSSAITIGFDLNFTLAVSNAGPNVATRVKVTDPLPFGLVFSSGSASQGTFSFASNTVFGDLGVLPPGNVATVSFAALPAITNLMTNTAIASAATFDPNLANNTSSTLNQGLEPIFDSDGDGMPNWWESRYGLNSFSSSGSDGADGDLDLDGVSNFNEWIADTRANDATSFFHIETISVNSGVTTLGFQSSPIRVYQGLFTPDLNAALTNFTSFNGNGTLMFIIHTNGDGGFYQLQAEAP